MSPNLDSSTLSIAELAAEYVIQHIQPTSGTDHIDSLAIGPGRRTRAMCSRIIEAIKTTNHELKRVVTNSAGIRGAFSEHSKIEIWVVGGKFDRESSLLIPRRGHNVFQETAARCHTSVFSVDGLVADNNEITFVVPTEDEEDTMKGLLWAGGKELVVMVRRPSIGGPITAHPVTKPWSEFKERKIIIITNEAHPDNPDRQDTTWSVLKNKSGSDGIVSIKEATLPEEGQEAAAAGDSESSRPKKTSVKN